MATTDRDCCWLINRDDIVMHVDEAYRRFARDNHTPALADGALGRSLWSFISCEELRQIWRMLVNRIRQGKGPFELPCRCDGPEVRRQLRLRVEAFTAEGDVLFRSRIVRQQPRTAVPVFDPSAPRDASLPLLRVCSWSNRIHTPSGWREAEEAVVALGLLERAALPPITHGMSEDCFEAVMATIDAAAPAFWSGDAAAARMPCLQIA